MPEAVILPKIVLQWLLDGPTWPSLSSVYRPFSLQGSLSKPSIAQTVAQYELRVTSIFECVLLNQHCYAGKGIPTW